MDWRVYSAEVHKLRKTPAAADTNATVDVAKCLCALFPVVEVCEPVDVVARVCPQMPEPARTLSGTTTTGTPPLT